MSPRFVEYIRVSGQTQAERKTQEIQRQALARLRERRPGEMIRGEGPTGAFEDLGISGAKSESERPAWAAVCDLIRARGVDEVRVVAIDRLTRSDAPGDWGDFVQTFFASDTVIVESSGAVADVRGKSGVEAIMLLMQAMAAGDERRRIKKRFLDGRRAAAQTPERGRGGWGAVPFGYMFQPGKGYVLDHGDLGQGWTPVTVVRRAFELLVEQSAEQVARILAAEGVPAPGGRQWTRSTLTRWTRKTVFMGVHVGILPPETDERGRPLPPPPAVEVHTDPDGSVRWLYTQPVEAIVSEAVWNAARAGACSRKHHRLDNFHEVDALCRYHLICGACGRIMQALNQQSGKNRYARYRCKGENCPHRVGYVIEAIDAAVWDVLVDGLCRPDGLAVAARTPSAVDPDPSAVIAEAASKQHALQVEIDDLLASFGGSSAAVRRSLTARVELLGQQVEHWERVAMEQRSLQTQHQELAHRLARAEPELQAIRRAIGQELTFPQRRRVVDLLFGGGGGRVLVHPTGDRRARLEVICNLLAPRPPMGPGEPETPGRKGRNSLRVVTPTSHRMLRTFGFAATARSVAAAGGRGR